MRECGRKGREREGRKEVRKLEWKERRGRRQRERQMYTSNTDKAKKNMLIVIF